MDSDYYHQDADMDLFNSSYQSTNQSIRQPINQSKRTVDDLTSTHGEVIVDDDLSDLDEVSYKFSWKKLWMFTGPGWLSM
jgi:hypothetical protein